jgi:hypothetical protein
MESHGLVLKDVSFGYECRKTDVSHNYVTQSKLRKTHRHGEGVFDLIPCQLFADFETSTDNINKLLVLDMIISAGTDTYTWQSRLLPQKESFSTSTLIAMRSEKDFEQVTIKWSLDDHMISTKVFETIATTEQK